MDSETEPQSDKEEPSNPPKGKSPKGKVFIDSERCKGCTYCVVFCKPEVLAMGGKLNRKGYHLPEVVNPEKCNGCDICGLFCPDFAIFSVLLKKTKKSGDES